MELSQLDPTSLQTRPVPSELDLYTIPSHSSWFVWDEIHDTEVASLGEFFDLSSFTRTPKVYKEYRDFIINKYREEPSRRLKFTEVRKLLVGDVNLLRKVFLQLEKWGLINFSAPPEAAAEARGIRVSVKVEEGVPSGIRVVAMPNSIKPITVELANAAEAEDKKEASSSAPADVGGQFPTLASYSDVFADLIRQKNGIARGNCGDRCDSGHYKHIKDNFSICTACFDGGKYGENNSAGDFKLTEAVLENHKYGASWSDAETLLLLESVMKNGENWDLVAQNIPTKTKLDCIAKLIELPVAVHLGSWKARKSDKSDELTSHSNSSMPLSENQETPGVGNLHLEKMIDGEQNGEAAEGTPLKRQRVMPVSGSDGSLMEQVACISAMVDPRIAAAAAEAAVTSLCEENSWPREIFDVDNHDGSEHDGVPNPCETNRDVEVEESELQGGPPLSENRDSPTRKDEIPLSLRIRTSVATALGAAAAHAKLLADQEEKEIENLLATIIGTEIKKVRSKMEQFEYLETIMNKQEAEMATIEEALISERINVLRAAFKSGIPRWKEQPSTRP